MLRPMPLVRIAGVLVKAGSGEAKTAIRTAVTCLAVWNPLLTLLPDEMPTGDRVYMERAARLYPAALVVAGARNGRYLPLLRGAA